MGFREIDKEFTDMERLELATSYARLRMDIEDPRVLKKKKNELLQAWPAIRTLADVIEATISAEVRTAEEVDAYMEGLYAGFLCLQGMVEIGKLNDILTMPDPT